MVIPDRKIKIKPPAKLKPSASAQRSCTGQRGWSIPGKVKPNPAGAALPKFVPAKKLPKRLKISTINKAGTAASIKCQKSNRFFKAKINKAAAAPSQADR